MQLARIFYASNQQLLVWSHPVMFLCDACEVHVHSQLALPDMQIGEYFEGIAPEESCYQVNAYLNYRYPEDWISAI